MHLLVLRSSEAHSRRRECLLSVDQSSFPQKVFCIDFHSGPGVHRVGFPLPPRSRRLVVKIANSSHAFLEGAGTRASAGSCAEIASCSWEVCRYIFSHVQTGMQAVQIRE